MGWNAAFVPTIYKLAHLIMKRHAPLVRACNLGFQHVQARISGMSKSERAQGTALGGERWYARKTALATSSLKSDGAVRLNILPTLEITAPKMIR